MERQIIIRSFCVVMLSIILLAACGHENPVSQQDVAFPEIRVFLAPSAPHQNITKATVSISAPDMDTITEDLTINGNSASGELEVPVGSGRQFTIEAYEGNIVRHRGSRVIDVPAGDPILLDIYLEPAALSIIVKSTSELVSVGDKFAAEVKVSNVNQLYAVAFMLLYDTNLLRVVEQETKQGDFLGYDTLFFQRIDDGVISIANTLKGNVNGVDGSGVVAVISFETLATGMAKIEFIQDQRLSLANFDGENVAGFDEIFVIDETVIIE